MGVSPKIKCGSSIGSTRVFGALPSSVSDSIKEVLDEECQVCLFR